MRSAPISARCRFPGPRVPGGPHHKPLPAYARTTRYCMMVRRFALTPDVHVNRPWSRPESLGELSAPKCTRINLRHPGSH